MKKKLLLLVIMVMLFVCAFAITASAADIPEWTEVITYDSITYKEGFDTTSRVLLANGDGTYSTYPTNYIIKGTDATFDEKEIDFTALKAASGNSTYKNSSIVRIELPVGFTSVDKWMFRPNYGLKTTSILTVKFPEGITSLGAKMFYDSTAVEIELPDSLETLGDEFAANSLFTSLKVTKNLKEIPYRMFYQSANIVSIDFSEAESLKTIGESAFSGCTSLESAILPEGLTTLVKYAFYKSGVKNVYLPSTITDVGLYVFELSAVEVVESYSPIIGENMFYKCNNLRKITLENTVSIGKYGFLIESGKTSYVTELVLPETLTTIGSYGLARTAITELCVPASVTQVDTYAFSASKSLEKVVVLGNVIGEHMFQDCSSLSELVLAQPLKTYGNANSLGSVSTKFTTYFVGNDYEATKTLMNVSSRISGAKVYSYEDYASHTDNYRFVYGCNLCEVAFDGDHTIPNLTYVFTSFVETACTKGICTMCGLEEDGGNYDAIFEGFYYSTRESLMDGGCGIAFTYRINNESLAAYLAYNSDKALSFGIFGAFQKNITSEDAVVNPLNADGSAKQGLNGIISADITNKNLSCIDFVIRGTEEQWVENNVTDEALYMVGYVTDGDTLYYMGSKDENVHLSSSISDLGTITYNGMKE